jgi:hypothetical protein
VAARKAAENEAKELEAKAEELRRELLKVESSIKRKREQQDEGDDMRGGDTGSLMNDDEGPEVMSTRQGSGNSVPPPPRKADPTKHCKYFSTGGTCGKRGKCRFVHDPAVREQALREREANGGRPTLMQRLIMQEKDQEDLAVVKTVKYLQDKGLLPKKTASTAEATNKAEPKPAENGEKKTEGAVLPEKPASAAEATEKSDAAKPEEAGESDTEQKSEDKTTESTELAEAKLQDEIKALLAGGDDKKQEPAAETTSQASATKLSLPNGLPPRPVLSSPAQGATDTEPRD